MNNKRKKIAIVTGAGSGIGQEFVLQLFTYMPSLDQIWLLGRNKANLEETAKQIEGKGKIIPFDITNALDLELFSISLLEENPKVAALVCAAGVGYYGEFENGIYEKQLEMIDCNCKALTAVTHKVLPFMKSGSRLFLVSSSTAILPQKEFAVYAATKSYVLTFALGLRKSCQDKGIHMTCVCPGPVQTPFLARAYENKPMPWWKKPFVQEASAVVEKALLANLRNLPISF